MRELIRRRLLASLPLLTVIFLVGTGYTLAQKGQYDASMAAIGTAVAVGTSTNTRDSNKESDEKLVETLQIENDKLSDMVKELDYKLQKERSTANKLENDLTSAGYETERVRSRNVDFFRENEKLLSKNKELLSENYDLKLNIALLEQKLEFKDTLKSMQIDKAVLETKFQMNNTNRSLPESAFEPINLESQESLEFIEIENIEIKNNDNEKNR